MKDIDFRKEIGVGMSRSRIRQWKKEYFKTPRLGTIAEFYKNLTTSLQSMTSSKAPLERKGNV